MSVGANRRVLCVDDEPLVLEGLERTLFEHFDVTTASSPVAAVALLTSEPPFAVILSDMRMPVMRVVETIGGRSARQAVHDRI